MQPRLPFSSKWTPIPDELADQITEIFEENFASYIKKGRIFVEGRIYLREVLLSVGYKENGRLHQDNFEVSIEYAKDRDNMVKMIHLGVDCAASMLEQFFGDPGGVDFPKTWKGYEVEGRQVFLQYTTENTELEAEADRLLGENEGGLMRGEDSEEELEQKISMLGLSDEDFPEGQSPTKKKSKTKKKTKKR
ncbi:MAG: hypothetical protein H6624_04910 [Bdellovibrionaceae bacterium]|nr:hypothetical protein [Bdellovibrionales bacterium]MCB9083658.1 hypothetical protein [Pseudobdellovibrionaceae bacterium]